MSTVVYNVSGMSCQHCVNAITEEVGAVAGVTEVAVDLDGGLVTVTAGEVDHAAIRAAIVEAGYDVV
jgi:copper chaperone